jgi:hypothetical protein
MAIEDGIVLLRKRPYAATLDGKAGIQQEQKNFLRKTRQGRVQKGQLKMGEARPPQ